MFVLCLLPVVELGLFKLKFFVVELDLAEMACVSRNIRTTRSESLALFRSNVPFLSVRSRILVFLYLNIVNMMSHCFMEDEVGAGFRW